VVIISVATESISQVWGVGNYCMVPGLETILSVLSVLSPDFSICLHYF